MNDHPHIGRAVVFDNGSFSLKSGFAGDCTPQYVAPNRTARPINQLRVLVGDEILSITDHKQLLFYQPFERGLLANAGCLCEV